MQPSPPILLTRCRRKHRSARLEMLGAGLQARAAAPSLWSVEARFGDRVQGVTLDFTAPATWAAACQGVESMFLMRPPHPGRPKQQMLPALEAVPGIHGYSAGNHRRTFLRR